MNRFIFTFCLLIFHFHAHAGKEGNTISGKITDKDNMPLAGASIVLLKDSGQLVKVQISDGEGMFAFEDVRSGTYLLKVLLGNYVTEEKTLIVSGPMILPDIVLRDKMTQLGEVAIRAQRPFIEVRADKVVVNVENSIVSSGSSVMEVLQRSPGVSVDNNDNISLKGKQGAMIWINGKQTPMTGADLAAVLRSMPANVVDKVELIASPGARYDAAGSAGIINIILKKDQRIGANGSVSIGYGQGIYPKYNGGVQLNYRNRKLNVYGSYNYANRLWFNHLMLNRRFLDTSKGDRQLFRYDQDNNTVFDFKNHIANAGIDYTLSRKTTAGISVTAMTNFFNPKADNFSRALGPGDELLYRFNTTGRHKNFHYNYSANSYLKHQFDSNGRELSVDLDYAVFGNQSNQNFVTVYDYVDVTQKQPDYYLKTDLSGFTQIRSVKADYVHPLRSHIRVETGAKSSYVTADNKPVFLVKTTGDYQLDPSRTNHFIYNENINAAYINAAGEWKKISAMLGLRLEHTNIQFRQNAAAGQFDTGYAYTQLFPSLAIQYHLHSTHDLGLTFSRRIERPNYQQLNPFKYYIDRTTYREGDPQLSPASFYSAELSYVYKQRFITTFTYGVNKGVITEVIQPSDREDSVTVQTNKNLDRMTFLGLNGSYSFAITKWWNNVTSFNAYYARYEGFVANTPLNNGRPTFDFNTANTFLLPYDFSAELGGWYQARQLYAYMDVQPLWMLNAGIQKNLFDRRATLRLNIQDVFWKGYPRATSEYTGYREDFIAERETRVANIAFTYRFGKRTLPQNRRHNSGAEDEKKRAAGNGS